MGQPEHFDVGDSPLAEEEFRAPTAMGIRLGSGHRMAWRRCISAWPTCCPAWG